MFPNFIIAPLVADIYHNIHLNDFKRIIISVGIVIIVVMAVVVGMIAIVMNKGTRDEVK